MKRDHRGIVSVFVVISFIGILAILGLLNDGAEIRNERRQLSDLASQAARVAAQEIDLEELRATGQLVLDPTKARNRAISIIEERLGLGSGVIVEVSISENQINIMTQRSIQLLGNREIDVRAESSAKATTQIYDVEAFP